jgi:hypothetical protein
MKPPIHDASARQRLGEPSPVPGQNGNWTNRLGSTDVAEVDRQIAELVDRSTHELRLAWRQLHRTGPPLGLSRDLLIRALANQLQEHAGGGTSRALRRRLQTLAGELEKGGPSFDPGIVLKTADIGASVARTLCCTDQQLGEVSPPHRHLFEANVFRPPKLRAAAVRRWR